MATTSLKFSSQCKPRCQLARFSANRVMQFNVQKPILNFMWQNISLFPNYALGWEFIPRASEVQATTLSLNSLLGFSRSPVLRRSQYHTETSCSQGRAKVSPSLLDTAGAVWRVGERAQVPLLLLVARVSRSFASSHSPCAGNFQWTCKGNWKLSRKKSARDCCKKQTKRRKRSGSWQYRGKERRTEMVQGRHGAAAASFAVPREGALVCIPPLGCRGAKVRPFLCLVIVWAHLPVQTRAA